jgi:hypothetical protein
MREERSSQPHTTIGWREYVALPEWGLPYVKAKADTGARTSAIDVANVTAVGENRVRFDIVADRRGEGDGERVTVEAEVVRRTRVKSSFGDAHDRIIVETLLRLGPVEKRIELSLVSRKNMLCRMLLGRKALEPEFVVDSAHRYLFGRRPRRKRTKR